MSVKDVAAALGVSDVTIYSKLKLKDFSDKVVKKGNKSMIDEDLFNLIKESLNLTKNLNNNLNYDENKKNNSSEDESLGDNLSLIKLLNNQLNVKDQQIAQLTQMLADANAKRDEHAAHISRLLENEQVLRGHKEGAPIKNKLTDNDETAVELDILQNNIIEDVQELNNKVKAWWEFWK